MIIKNEHLLIELDSEISLKELELIQEGLLSFLRSESKKNVSQHHFLELRNLLYLAIKVIKFKPSEKIIKEIKLPYYDYEQSLKLIELLKKYEDPFILRVYLK